MQREPDGIEVVATAAEAAKLEAPPFLVLSNLTRFFDEQGIGSGHFAWQRIGDGQAAHRRKRVCSVTHGPYFSGTSRQAVPVRNFHTIPLRTLRSSNRFRPRKDAGSSGRTNSHSASDSSWRRITRP
jgi:hypothetical protein